MGLLFAQQGHNIPSHRGGSQYVGLTPMWGVLYPCCAPKVQIAFSNRKWIGLSQWKMLFALQMHNMGTTPPHMRVSPIHWDSPPMWEGVVSCCALEVQITSPYLNCGVILAFFVHNNDTIPRHIGVGPNVWALPQCTLVLCHWCALWVFWSFSISILL
jgi:hypothetical protein